MPKHTCQTEAVTKAEEEREDGGRMTISGAESQHADFHYASHSLQEEIKRPGGRERVTEGANAGPFPRPAPRNSAYSKS